MSSIPPPPPSSLPTPTFPLKASSQTMKLTFFTASGESFFLELPSDMSIQDVKTLLEGDVSPVVLPPRRFPSVGTNGGKKLVSDSMLPTLQYQSNVPVADQIWTVDGKEVVESEKTLEELGWPEEVVVSFARKQR